MIRLYLAFVQAGECGPVHVALTSNVQAHMRRMQACNPEAMRLVAAVRGSYTRETRVLGDLAPWMYTRRWYSPVAACALAAKLEKQDQEAA